MHNLFTDRPSKYTCLHRHKSLFFFSFRDDLPCRWSHSDTRWDIPRECALAIISSASFQTFVVVDFCRNGIRHGNTVKQSHTLLNRALFVSTPSMSTVAHPRRHESRTSDSGFLALVRWSAFMICVLLLALTPQDP